MPSDRVPGPRSPHPAGRDLEPAPLELIRSPGRSTRHAVTVLAAATVCAALLLAWTAYLTVWVVEAAAAPRP